MAATFYQRVLQIGDWENDGGAIDLGELYSYLVLYEGSLMSAAQIKSFTNCTTAQEDDVDEILGTMPNTILSALNATARARWPHLVYNVFKLGLYGAQGDTRFAAFDSEADIKAALGI